jgi:Subtilase family/Concanavalin A-like lectin/glucanases superfamily/Immunoglobulin I-set domain/HYR domain/Beta-propeller repeat
MKTLALVLVCYISVVISGLAQPSNCVAPPAGLALWLPFDEAIGTNTANLVPFGNPGVLTNGPTQGPGYVRGGLCFFNGGPAPSYVYVPDYPGMDPGTGDFTLDAWIKTSGLGGRPSIIVDKRSPSGQFGFSFWVHNNNLVLELADGGATDYSDTATVPVDNQWHFVAVTVSRHSTTGGHFFVDGVVTHTFNPTGNSGSLNNTNAFLVANSLLPGTSPWNGCIDEVEMFLRALQTNEIQAIYQAGAAGKCKPAMVLSNLPPATASYQCLSAVPAPPIVTATTWCAGGAFLNFNETQSNPGSSCSNVVTRTWFGSDLCGNSSNFVQTITVNNTTPPVIACASNKTVSCGSSWSFDTPTATDNCSGTNVAITILNTITNGQCPQLITQTWLATDCAGRTNTCSQTVTVAPCVPPPSGLVNWWPGDSNALDIVGGVNGAITGNVSYATGIVGPAFDFDGTGGYVRTPGTTTGMPQGTIDLWFQVNTWNWNSDPNGTYFWAATEFLPDGSSSGDGMNLGNHPDYTSTGELMFGIYTNGWQWAHSGVVPQTNTWYHVAGTWGPDGIQIYVNGALMGANSYTGPAPAYTLYNLIGRSSWPSTAINGLVDEVEIFDRALSSNEINAIYTAGPAGKCKSPVVICSTDKIVPCGSAWSFDPPVVANSCQGTNYVTALPPVTNGACPATFTETWLISNSCWGVTYTCTQHVSVITCTPPPAGMVAWWPGDGNTLDYAGGNNGILGGNATYVPGEVGPAFSFDGNNAYMNIPGSDNLGSPLNLQGPLTVDAWVLLKNLNANPGRGWAIVDKTAPSGASASGPYALGISADGLGNNYFLGIIGNGSSASVLASATTLQPGVWYHVAFTADGTTLKMFVNGALDSMAPQTVLPVASPYLLRVGGIPGQPANTLDGLIDELEIFNRPLSSNDIYPIDAAGYLGKCKSPTITGQPQNQTVSELSSTTLSVDVVGEPPLGYQWYYLGQPILGATGSSLSISNIMPTNLGAYSVTVSNELGSVSAAATLSYPLDVNVWINNGYSLTTAQTNLVNLGAQILEVVPFFQRITCRLTPAQFSQVAGASYVRNAEAITPAMPYSNYASRDGISALQVQKAPWGVPNPFNLSGSGVNIGVCDYLEPDYTHPDFTPSGRVVVGGGALAVQNEFPASLDQFFGHFTHVVGTLAGNGSYYADKVYAGLAPNAQVYTYSYKTLDNSGNLADSPLASTKMLGAVTDLNHPIVISQNSWGYAPVGSQGTCYLEGSYIGECAEFDTLVQTKNLATFFAAGNGQDGIWPDPSGPPGCTVGLIGTPGHYYGTVTPLGTAKNVVTVGAIGADTSFGAYQFDVMTPFSCWGPTKDGRLKPDVVALGWDVTSCFPQWLASPPYAADSGTSQACPAVSGTAALLIEESRAFYAGYQPSPALLKAVLCNTADDLGNPGPDFQFGYGRVNALRAVETIQAGQFVDNTNGISTSGDWTTNITVSSGCPGLRVMLAWSDAACANNCNSLNPFTPCNVCDTKALVNDLDLTVTDPTGNTTYLPLTLDPTHAMNLAVPAANHRDNVEQVVIANAVPGVYRVNVKGFNVPQGPQAFALTWISDCASTNPCGSIQNGNFDAYVPANSTGGGWTSENISADPTSGGWFATEGNPDGTFLLNASGDPNSDPTIYQTVCCLTNGQCYTIHGQVKVQVWDPGVPTPTNGTPSFGVKLNDAWPPTFIYQLYVPPNDYDWHDFSANFTASSTCQTIYFSAEINGTDVSYYLDNVWIEPCNCLQISCPSNITIVSCTNNVFVNFTVTATNNCNTNPAQLVCVPPPGPFPPGVTTVRCTATDSDGHSLTTNFLVTLIEDDSPLTISSYPESIIVCTETNNCGYMPDATAEVLVPPSEGLVSVTQSIPPGQLLCANTTVTFTLTNQCGYTTNLIVPVVVKPCCCQAATNVVIVPGTADPWLAGMPGGTIDTLDKAPDESPSQFGGTVTGGEVFSFSAIGMTAYGQLAPFSTAGGLGPNISRTYGPNNGMSDLNAPLSSLVGVFLDNNEPSGFLVPATYSPASPIQLRQPFLIGDGTDSSGNPEPFTAPAGATRLFLGTMDGYAWLDNLGALTVTVISTIPTNTPCPPSITAPASITICTNGGGALIVNSDEWVFSIQGFNPYNTPGNDAARFAINCATYLTGGKGKNTLIASSDHGFPEYTSLGNTPNSAFYNALTGNGYTVTFGLPSSGLTLAFLQQFQAVFVGGDLLSSSDLAALADYICSGGGVYIAAGTGTYGAFGGDAANEANQWNTLIEQFGLTLSSSLNTINQVITDGGTFPTLTIPSASPVMAGVNTILYGLGNDVSLYPAVQNPFAQVVAFSGTDGIIGVSRCIGLMPDAASQVTVSGSPAVFYRSQSIPAGTRVVADTNVLLTISNACGYATNFSLPVIVENCSTNCPADIVTVCSNNAGAQVCFTLPVISSLGPCTSSVVVVYADWPGATASYTGPTVCANFPMGITPVTVTAFDQCGNSNTCTFTITVLGEGGSVGDWHGSWALADGNINPPSGTSQGNGIAVDTFGNSYVAGTFTGTAVFHGLGGPSVTLSTPANISEGFVAKYDPIGHLLWAQSTGGYDSVANGVAVDAQGNCFVTGSFERFIFQFRYHSPLSCPGSVLLANGHQDMFLAKFDPQGDLLWAINAGDPGGVGVATGAGVAVDGNGDAYVAGGFQSQASFGYGTYDCYIFHQGPTFGNSATSDAFLAKYDGAGNLKWARGSDCITPAGTGAPAPDTAAWATGVAVDAAGNAWICGDMTHGPSQGMVQFGATSPLTPSADGSNPSVAGYANAFVVRFDPNGSAVWAQQMASACVGGAGSAEGVEAAVGIGVDANDNCYFTAYFNGCAQLGSLPVIINDPNPMGTPYSLGFTANQLYDFLVGKLDGSGAPKWLINGNQLEDNESRGLAVTPDGHVFVTGPLNATTEFQSGGRDVMLNEYEPTVGAQVWPAAGIGYGSSPPANNAGQGVAVDAAGCVYITGGFNDSGTGTPGPDPGLVFPDFSTPMPLKAPGGWESSFAVKYCPACDNCITISPTNIVVGTCSNSVLVAYSVPVTDNCATNFNVTYSPPSPSMFPLGTSSVTVHVSDSQGNSNTSSFTVTVTNSCTNCIDLTCAGDKIVHCTSNWTFDPPTVIVDRCCTNGVYTNTLTVHTNSGPCPLVLVGTWQVTDQCSNTAFCSQKVTVTTDGPTITPGFTVLVTNSCGGPVTVPISAVATNSCCNNVTLTVYHPYPTVVASGVNSLATNVVCYPGFNYLPIRAVDCCGNTNYAYMVVKVTTNATPPTLSLATNVFKVCASNGCGTLGDVRYLVDANYPNNVTQNPPPGTVLCTNQTVTFTCSNYCGMVVTTNAYAVLGPCCDAPPTNMVLWLTFDEATGATCFNSAGPNNGVRRVVPIGKAVKLPGLPPVRTPGQYVDNCLCFDGSSYVNVPSYANVAFGTKSFSVDAWVKPTSGGGPVQVILMKESDIEVNCVGCPPLPVHPHGYALYLVNGVPTFEMYDGESLAGTPGFLSSYGPALSPNTWTYLAVTVDRINRQVLMYQNQAQSTPFAIPQTPQPFGSVNDPLGDVYPFFQGSLTVGVASYPYTNFFEGCLDEIELFKGVLASNDVRSLYLAAKLGKCRPAVGLPSTVHICPTNTSVQVSATVCNNGSDTRVYQVAFSRTSAATAALDGIPGAIDWIGGGSFSPSSQTITVLPGQCVTLNITVALSPNFNTGSSPTLVYNMVVTDPSTMDTSVAFATIVGDVADCSSGGGNHNHIYGLAGNRSTNLTFTISNPFTSATTFNAQVLAVDNQLQPDRANLSLDGLPPGTPVNFTVPLDGLDTTNVTVAVNFRNPSLLQAYQVLLLVDDGQGGPLSQQDASTLLDMQLPLIGPPLFLDYPTNGQAVISWDAINYGWTLEANSDLRGTNWVPVPLPVGLLPDGSQGVLLPPTNSAQFFRLTQ